MENNYSVYVHKVETEEGPMYYTGVTKQQLSRRWQPVLYKDMSLWPYIEKYGWENIEHAVVIDGLTYEKSREVEDMLIHMYWSLGCGINKVRSGLVKVLNPDYNKEKCKAYQAEHRNEIRDRKHQYYMENREEILKRDKEYHQAHREERNKQCREYYNANKEAFKVKNKKYRDTHKEEIREKQRQYYKEHREELTAKARERRRQKKLKHDDIDGPAE